MVKIVMRKPSGEFQFVRNIVRTAQGNVKKETVLIMRSRAKIGRNDPCPCNSGKKYKQCHMRLEREEN